MFHMKHLSEQQSEYDTNIYNTGSDVSHETFVVLLIELFSIKGDVSCETFLLCAFKYRICQSICLPNNRFLSRHNDGRICKYKLFGQAY